MSICRSARSRSDRARSTLETGKLAKQADGSVLVRSGDTVVLVTACHAASPREGIDFLPLTVDYREYTYASGRIPGGFFKREGKPPEKEVLTSRLIDRPIRPLFPAGWRYETQIIALLMSADTDNDSDVLAITGASAALALSEIPFEKTIAGVRVGIVDGKYVINPTYDERKHEPLDLIVAGSGRRHRHGRGRREGSQRGAGRRRARSGARGHQADRRRRSTSSKAAGKKKLQVQKKEVGHDVLPRGRGEDATCRSARRCASSDKLENYDTRRPGARATSSPRCPRAKSQRKVEAKHIFHELKEKVLRDEVLERSVRLDGRKFDEIRPIWTRGRRPAAHPRLGRLHPRRDAGARHLHARHRRRRAEDRARERRVLQALHAALQLPAVLGRRGAVPARPRPARDRPRRAGRARADAGGPRRRQVRLHRPPRLRHPRVERLLVDGVGLRRVDGDDGRRRADQGAGGGHRDGPDHGREVGPLGRPLRHRRRRGPLRRHGLQGRRHGAGHHRAADGHQGDRHHLGDHEQGARAGAGRTAAHPGRDGQDARRTARQHVDVRAADHHHQDPGGQDPRRHRPGRQDDPQHHRAHRRQDRRRGQRHASTSRRPTASRRRRRSASSRS